MFSGSLASSRQCGGGKKVLLHQADGGPKVRIRFPLLRERLVLSNWPAECVIAWDTLEGSIPNGAEVRVVW